MNYLTKVDNDTDLRDLKEEYRSFCKQNGLQYLEAEFSNFHVFFASRNIAIEVKRGSDGYKANVFDKEWDKHLASEYFDDREEAEKEAVYQGFKFLYRRD